MFKINGLDWELPQRAKTHSAGYEYEYIEHTMMSGKIRRLYKGKRFHATFSYGFLSNAQVLFIHKILAKQMEDGYCTIEMDYGGMTNYTFNGPAIITLNSDQQKFESYETGTDESSNIWVSTWINWNLEIESVDYV